jgi:hypothetical protein
MEHIIDFCQGGMRLDELTTAKDASSTARWLIDMVMMHVLGARGTDNTRPKQITFPVQWNRQQLN